MKGINSGQLDRRITEGTGDYTPLLGGSGEFVPLEIKAPDAQWLPSSDSPILRGINDVFDVREFEVPRTPHVVGRFALNDIPEGFNVNSMPIKFPGTEYRFPDELEPIRTLAEHVVSIEHEINPRADEFYSYASVYNTYVEAGTRQLAGRPHSDEVQGQRIQPKVTSGHQYLIADRDPTVFYPNQTFDMDGVDPDTHLLDDVFAEVDPAIAHQFEAGDLTLVDGYCIHDGIDASSSGYRSFVRFAFGVRQFDRLGNTRNALFEREYEQFGWQFEPRPMPANLIPPPERY